MGGAAVEIDDRATQIVTIFAVLVLSNELKAQRRPYTRRQAQARRETMQRPQPLPLTTKAREHARGSPGASASAAQPPHLQLGESSATSSWATTTLHGSHCALPAFDFSAPSPCPPWPPKPPPCPPPPPPLPLPHRLALILSVRPHLFAVVSPPSSAFTAS
jgi:hypothetical protein